MSNSIEISILLDDKSNFSIYCYSCHYSKYKNCFIIQYLNLHGDFEEMYIYLEHILSFEVYYL